MHRSATATTSTSIMFISAAGSASRDRTERRQPGVVHEDVGREAQLVDPVEQHRRAAAVGQVGGQDLGPDAGRAELVGQLGELVGAAGDQGDPVAAAGQLAGQLVPMPDDAPVTTAVRSGAAGKAHGSQVGPAVMAVTPSRAGLVGYRSWPMNPDHLAVCASDEWREMVHDVILPWALGDTDLGDHLLEVGPGFGVTTEVLRARVGRLTAVEIDADLAAGLTDRVDGANVAIVQGDASTLPFPDARFTGATSFAMLHHVPAPAIQDRLFAELARVLIPGGVLVASDSIASPELAAFHDDDIYVPIDPADLGPRLAKAGFVEAEVRSNEFGWATVAHTPG